MARSNMVEIGRGLARRLGHWVLMLGASLAASLPQARAENVMGLALDPGFGSGGYSALPRNALADAAGAIAPVGVVHLAVAGGYVALSVQPRMGFPRLVFARYNEDGSLNTGWGSGGSLMPGLPAPYAPGGGTHMIKLATAVEGGHDVYYVAFTLNSGADNYVAVGKFLADGSFDASFNGGYAATLLPASLPNGHGGLLAGATAGANLYGGGTGLVVAVTDGSRLAVTRAYASGTLSDDGSGYSLAFASSPHVYQMKTRADGGVDMVGEFNDGRALYIDYNAAARDIHSHVFHLHCPAGTDLSAIDAIERPTEFGGDVLIVGRTSCTGYGTYSVVQRISGIESTQSHVWTARTDNSTPCTSFGVQCDPALLTYVPGRDVQLTVTGSALFAPVKLSTGAPLTILQETSLSASITVQPSTFRGVALNFPRVVGFAMQGGQAGIGAVLIDGVFQNGFQ